jgi:ABC-type multidrug transport system fused ATPase/permease subunit
MSFLWSCVKPRSYFKDNDSDEPVQTRSIPLALEIYFTLRPILWVVVLATLFGLVATAASLFQPYYLSQVISELPTATTMSDLAGLFTVIGVCVLVEFLFNAMAGLILSVAGEYVVLLEKETLQIHYGTRDVLFRCQSHWNSAQQTFCGYQFPEVLVFSVYIYIVYRTCKIHRKLYTYFCNILETIPRVVCISSLPWGNRIGLWKFVAKVLQEIPGKTCRDIKACE